MTSPKTLEMARKICNHSHDLEAVGMKCGHCISVAFALTSHGKEQFRAGLLKAKDLMAVTASEIRLACGEMSAEQMRTVRAVLSWRANIIQQETEANKE